MSAWLQRLKTFRVPGEHVVDVGAQRERDRLERELPNVHVRRKLTQLPRLLQHPFERRGPRVPKLLEPIANRSWSPVELERQRSQEAPAAVAPCLDVHGVRIEHLPQPRGPVRPRARDLRPPRGTDGVDLLEISGGTYEQGASFGHGVPASTASREAYFLEFARNVRKTSRIPIMLTGGFRTRRAMDAALQENALDLIGLARPLVMDPELPRRLLAGEDGHPAQYPHTFSNKKIDGAAELAWYSEQLRRVSLGLEPGGTSGRAAASAATTCRPTGSCPRRPTERLRPADRGTEAPATERRGRDAPRVRLQTRQILRGNGPGSHRRCPSPGLREFPSRCADHLLLRSRSGDVQAVHRAPRDRNRRGTS